MTPCGLLVKLRATNEYKIRIILRKVQASLAYVLLLGYAKWFGDCAIVGGSYYGNVDNSL